MLPEDIESLDKNFNKLSEITDRVALINSPYESQLDQAICEMENFIENIYNWDFINLSPEVMRSLLSHLSFHREIVSDIISEARQQLVEERREFLKRIVVYHKTLARNLLKLERKGML
jgi:hypothetical protein